MIVYVLKCEADHRFESSFASISTYEKLEKRRALECPHCGSRRVTRAPMAPAIAKGKSPDGPKCESVTCPEAEAVAAAKEFVRENFEDVGEAFPEEARALYYDEGDARRRYRSKLGLVGKATPEEAKSLHEEGVPISLLPERKYDA